MAALNRARRDVWQHAEDRLRHLVTKALDCIDDGLEGSSDVHTALAVLKVVGRLDVVPRGATDARQIAQMQELSELLASG